MMRRGGKVEGEHNREFGRAFVEVFPQTVREGGPAEKRTCDDVFAAMQRLVDARDPSYRD